MRGVVLSAGGGQHGSLGHGDAVTQLSVLTPIRALEGTHATDRPCPHSRLCRRQCHHLFPAPNSVDNSPTCVVVLDNLNFFALFSPLPHRHRAHPNLPPPPPHFSCLHFDSTQTMPQSSLQSGGRVCWWPPFARAHRGGNSTVTPHSALCFLTLFFTLSLSLSRLSFWRHAWPQVFSFGNGLHGRLGHGNEATCFEPRRIAFFHTTAGVAKISAGTTHSLALTKDGKAYSFGFGMFGRLGHGDETDQLLPREITLRGHGASPSVGDRTEEEEEDERGPTIEHIAAGYFHSLLLTTDGTTATRPRTRHALTCARLL